MNKIYAILTLIGAVLLGTPVATAEDDGPGERPNRTEMREKMIERFDTDGDGKLNDEERAKARSERPGREGRARGPKGEGSRGKGGRREGARGPQEGDRRRGPGGPEGDRRMDPNRVFDHFDADGNGQLSREEFGKLHATIANRMAGRGGPGSPGGPGARGLGGPEGPHRGEARGPRGDRPQGPPLEGRGERPRRPRGGDFDGKRPGPPGEQDIDESSVSHGPHGKHFHSAQRGKFDAHHQHALSNPGFGREGGKPEVRNVAKKDGQRKAKGGAQDKGQGARGKAQGQGSRMDQMFDRFDADGNGQLNRREFSQLAERMQQRGKKGGGPRAQDRGSKSERRGPPDGKQSGRPDFSGSDSDSSAQNETV